MSTTGDEFRQTISVANYPKRLPLAQSRNRARDIREKTIEYILLVAASISILTTLGILASLIFESLAFFQEVSLAEFFGGTTWTPTFEPPRFGIWALLAGTFLTSLIALFVAVPLGLTIAIYLSEFASARIRDTLKPILELLAGIPTVVFGFFALTVVTPFLKIFFPGIETFNALSAGLIMGIMIVPLVSSLSEDAMSAVPNSLREGAYALGVTRFEMATRVVVPAALSGIVASIILALSRAIGETMVVAIAAGNIANFTANPINSVQTVSAFIVSAVQGDIPAGSREYHSVFAAGITLFVLTFALNIFSSWFVRRFREVYE